MRGHGQKLTTRQERLIAALLAEPTYAKAAQTAGVGEGTVFRWLKLAVFQAAYAEARQQVLGRAVARLLATCDKAVTTLEKGLTGREPGARIRAATAILDRALKGTETLDLARQVEDLTRRLAAMEKKR